MIDIPLYIFLFMFFIVLAIFAAYYLIIIYHIVHSASFTLETFFMTFFVFACAAFLLYGVADILQVVNWQETVFTIDLGIFGEQTTF